MTRIAIGSIFRNSTGYLDRYVTQVANLTGHLTGLGFDIHLVAAEGDSSDDTYDQLKTRLEFLHRHHKNVTDNSLLTLIKAEHGGPVFGSVDVEQRWRNISFVCNKLLDSITQDDDVLLYVESDLIWDAPTMRDLLSHIIVGSVADAVAPLSIHQPTGLFYDTWGHRKDGMPFQQQRPYHPGVGARMTPIDSAGSCIAMRGEVARTCRFTPPEQCIVGFGNDIRSKGYTFYLDPMLRVLHP